MRPSIVARLIHPRTAINQGLPTSRHQSAMRAGEPSAALSEDVERRVGEYLKAIPLQDTNASKLAQQAHLYDALSIIDSKAQALLSFNSFLLAIVGIYFGTVQAIRDQLTILIPFVTTVIASGLSCLLSLDVVWVHWLTIDDMTDEEDLDGDVVGEGFVELLLLRDERTRTYRVAWLLSFVSVAAVVCGVIAAIFVNAV